MEKTMQAMNRTPFGAGRKAPSRASATTATYGARGTRYDDASDPSGRLRLAAMEDRARMPLLGIFNDCFPPIMDGVSVTMQNYAYWLSQKTPGNVCVVTPKDPRASDDDFPYSVFRYSSCYLPFRKPYRLGIPLIDWSFHMLMGGLPFGLVHAHCPFSSGKIAMRIAHKRHIPLVATFHSKYRDDFARIVPYPCVLNHIVRGIVDFYEAADEVWIPQASVEDTLRDYGYKGKVEVVENGNDFDVDDPIASVRDAARRYLNIDVGENVFLFVGQHIWEKNIRFLLLALSRMHGYKFRMYFVGTGYAAKEIRHLADVLGLTPRVTFVGAIEDRDVLKQYYAAADLFLFPSVYDNAPLVVREAAALQTPSVLLAGSTAAEVVEHGFNGFVSAAEVDDYASLVDSLMCRKPYIRQVGANARNTIVRPWSDVVDEVIDRYAHLLKRF
jgi:1,2-diacylglycerol 3-alpha-glucosyltransferase